jgi:hypothetical protein
VNRISPAINLPRLFTHFFPRLKIPSKDENEIKQFSTELTGTARDDEPDGGALPGRTKHRQVQRICFELQFLVAFGTA